ncbi:hypothetical protein [Chitinophaga sp. XS-30]|uniref:hypothetical protein n=1 Tax=Chitinophaga sp. XS-30 TaxID=2604421 RepID=UPI0011DE17F7|nr:hypothetical protein [Chitinophaga sp. XS-30]QEH43313.1 hypothetical protein FW415_21600 [Chitinophaga sp. XS-30]
MNIQRVFIVLSVTLLAWCNASVAQATIDTGKFFMEIGRLQQVMQSVPVSFDIRYTYTSEKDPDMILDSLKGSVQLSGPNTWYKVAHMESVSNDRYNIILFREDKLMYLSRPSKIRKDDPLQQIRSILAGSGVESCSIVEEGDTRTIRIDFKEGGACREMSMYVSRKTGYMSGVTYVLKAALLPGQGLSSDKDAQAYYGEYAVVKMELSGYKKLEAGGARFDEHNFFHREGDEFTPAPEYADYTIFKGSPNL